MVNNRWARLSQNEKAELLGIYTSMGYNDLASIIAHYNSCGGKLKADGGPVTNTAQYKSDAYLYNPPVNVGAPIEVPLRYKPLPDYGDYVPQRTTGMFEDIPIELGLEVPQRGYGVLMPDAPSAVPTLDARQDAARRIMAVENSKNNVNGGYDAKTGRWYPHKSHEGGADTIAYGIKLSNGTPEAALALKQGYLTDEQAESAVDSLVQKYYDAAKKVYDERYGAGEWDKLSDKSQSILVDYSYNPGLAKFPKLMEGFHSGNLDLIRKNYKRYSGGKELGRNKVLLEELDTLENEYPIFRANGGNLFETGGPSSGMNPLTNLFRTAKEKYLTDYANRGKMYSYPHSVRSLVENYILSPYNYDKTEREQEFRTAQRRALFSKYYGLENTDFSPDEFIVESRYRPSKSKNTDARYYTYKIDDVFDRSQSFLDNNGKVKMDFGNDEKGNYISIYDVWDLAPFGSRVGNQIGGAPIEMYDRFYESENPRVYYRLKDMASDDEYASGGKIHIKPENRGKFTALKKRTGHSASWFKAHGTPAQKKMATFALNARKWKHEDGGPIVNYLDDGGPYGVIPLGGDYLSYLQTMPEVSGGTIDPAVVTAALPAKFNGSQEAARRYAEGYQKGAKPVSEAMNRAGQNIFRAADTVAGFIPGPISMIDWLGHMGADAAEGNWGKVGRDVALATALGAGSRGVGWLKNYIDDATNFGEDVFRAFTDRVPGRVSTNFTYTAPVARATVEAVPAVAKAASTPYEIENLGGGYMLKSLMRGNPLEKQIGKNGTVNVNNVRALVGKGSKVEQAVVDKVLTSEEFAGKKSIDYNKFRKAVQDELITYERTPNKNWNNYGIDRLGIGSYKDAAESPEMINRFNEFIKNNFSYDPDSDRFFTPGDSSLKPFDPDDLAKMFFEDGPGFLDTPVGVTKKLDTFTFSSSRIPQGSNKHYNANTLGHSRTYTTTDEPDVLHVMESQSDWAQSGKAVSSSEIEKQISSLKQSLAMQEENLKNNGRYFAPKVRKDVEGNIDYLKEQIEEYDSRLKDAAQSGYLRDNYTSRQIQENLRYAAEKGQTKMRYPTRETAAKIEGYPEREAYFNEKGEEISIIRNKSQEVSEQMASLYTFGEEVDKEIAELQSGVKKYDDLISAWQGIPPEDPLDDLAMRDNERRWESYCSYLKYASKQPRASFNDYQRYENEASMFEKKFGHKPNTDKDVAEIEEALRESDRMHSRLLELSKGEAELRPGITKKTVYDYEDILRKYTEFPKQYQKLYKGSDVRTITDSKGNTWYEVDVPENYLQQEWAYKNGGRLREFDNISSLF